MNGMHVSKKQQSLNSMYSAIQETTKSFVIAFFHNIQKSFYQKHIIPKPIIQYSTVYLAFCGSDKWCKHSSQNDIQINSSTNTISRPLTLKHDWATIFGELQIKQSEKYFWELTIVHALTQNILSNRLFKNGWTIVVGIVPNPQLIQDSNKTFISGNYGFIGSSCLVGKAQKYPNKIYGEKFEKKGDVIRMVLNMKNNTLSFQINGNDYGVACETYPYRDGYTLALSLCPGMSIKCQSSGFLYT